MRPLLASLLISAFALPAWAAPKPLTQAERVVCQSAKQCADIVRRHGPESFDYAVLAAEFVRLKQDSVSRLQTLVDAGLAGRVQTLAYHRPELQTGLVAALIASGKTKQHALAAYLVRDAALSELPSMSADAVGAFMDRHPEQTPIGLLDRVRESDRVELLREALASGSPELAGAAYQRLHALDPDMALRALVDVMRRTENLDKAVAIGKFVAARDASEASGFYATMLDDIARDPGYSTAMRDGARAGSLMIARNDAPLMISPDLADQFQRLAATDGPIFAPQQVARTKGAILPIWQAVAASHPDRRLTALQSAIQAKVSGAELAPFIALGLDNPRHMRLMGLALMSIDWPEVARWEARLAAIARSHPSDWIRWEAQRKLDRDVGSDAFARSHFSDMSLPAGRDRARYCLRGTPVDAEALLSQLPPLAGVLTRTTMGPPLARFDASSAFPGRTRWLVGYDRGEFGGALAAHDYATGEAALLLDTNTLAVLPPAPPALGQTPDAVWVFAGMSAMGRGNTQIYSVATDAETPPVLHADLPGWTHAIHRLDDGSLHLSFHPSDADDIALQRYHPPLRLMPDGTLRPGCEGESLAGEAPPLFP